MKKLGQKIKELRTEKGFSQASISPNIENNSIISHIENSKIRSPGEKILKHIAKELEIDFDELVKNTDYQPEPISARDTGIAVSQTDFTIKIENNRSFKIYRKAYPRYDINGRENIYCPRTGTPLITLCSNNSCKNPIESPDFDYCMGCGSLVFFDFRKVYYEHRAIFQEIWTDTKKRREYEKWPEYLLLDDDFGEEDADYFDYTDSFSDEDILTGIKYMYNDSDKPDNIISGAEKWTAGEFRKGVFSSIPEIVNEYVKWEAKKTFAREYMLELMKFEQLEENPIGEKKDDLLKTDESDSKNQVNKE